MRGGADTSDMAEARAQTRFPTNFRAESLNGAGKVRNVSEGGLFVITRAIPEEGESIALTLKAPGRLPIRVTGFVWWTTKDRKQPQPRPGFALRLLDENERYLQLVASLT